MISRSKGAALLGTLLVLSLLLKIPGSLTAKELTAEDVRAPVSKFLKNNGFEPDANGSDEDLFLVSATAGECQLLVALASPQGWHRHVIRKLGSMGSRVLFVYDGKSYDDQPVLLTRTYDYWSRFIRFLGGNPAPRPVYGIVGSPTCPVDTMPWGELTDGRGDDG